MFRIALLCVLAGLAWPALAQTTRVLLIGDSWADQQWTDGSHALVFTANGFADISVDGSQTTVSGSTAEEWIAPQRLQLIADVLASQPSIDTVQVTLGGNDFLDAWHTGMSPEDEAMLMATISDRLDALTTHVLDQRPDIEVLLSFYDYPNFHDTLGSVVGQFVCLPLWNELGQPAPAALNAAAAAFESAYAALASSHPRIFHVSHFGLMQFTYGFPDDGIAPGDLLPPGDASRPSPVASMRNHGFLGRDCFHLTPAGYDVLVQNLVDGYFRTRFEAPLDESIFADSFEG